MRTTEELMRDVMHDESYLAFREGLKADLTRQLRRQRAARFQRLLLAAAACLPIAAGLILFRSGPEVRPSRGEPSSALPRVHTVALEPECFIVTGSTGLISANSESPTSTPRLSVMPGKFQMVRTAAQPLQLLNDEQLLDAFRGQAVVLAYDGWGRRQLLLPENPEGVR